MTEKTDDLIDEARQAVLTMDYTLAYQGGLVGRLADALEAATREPSDGDRESIAKQLSDIGAVRKVDQDCPCEDCEATTKWVNAPLGVVLDLVSRAAVPDAATEELERAHDLIDLREFEIDNLHELISELRAERDAAIAVLKRVRALHQAREDRWCSACAETNDQTGEFQDFPCPTIQALDGAPEPEWELDEQWEGGQPNGLGEIEPTTEREWFTPERETHRRKVISLTGPWLPVEGEKL